MRRAPGVETIGWLPRGPGGRPVVPGTYRARLTAIDRAGNEAASRWRTFRILRSVTSHVSRGFTGVGKVAALTFDDCGNELAWSTILSTLDRMHVRAAFFCLGGRITGSPTLARRTAAGHTMGNHTWSHAYLPGVSEARLASDLSRVDAAWWNAARVSPAPFFRPPYGSHDASNLAVAGSRGYACTTLWSVDPLGLEQDRGVGHRLARALSCHPRRHRAAPHAERDRSSPSPHRHRAPRPGGSGW